ncbi:GTP-binding protein Era, partial [Vibrio parahaemolyticus VPTS-2010]
RALRSLGYIDDL